VRRALRWLRGAALALGYPLVIALAAGLLFVTFRLGMASLAPVPTEADPDRLQAKQEYLESIGPAPAGAPNFVVVFFDDLGWGDLSVQGNALIDTPHIDRVAGEGLRFTNFYSASPVCTPSRAAMLTGRYPPRAGVSAHVYFPDESWMGLARRAAGVGNELPRDEILLPEVLRSAGYATGMVGKWHLGGMEGHRPRDFGFDSYFGVLWSNDMTPLDLIRDDAVILADARPTGWGERDEEQPLGPGGIDQTTLTQQYTDEAIAFLESSKRADRPFFLYLAHSFPHVPHYPSREHAGESAGGRYGDVVEDLDRSTGAVLAALDRLGLAGDTLVVITSDNGADYGGSPGPLRGRKGEVLEGGQRVPAIVRWPGRVPPGAVTDAMAMNIDLFATFLALAGMALPSDREIDGRDLTPLLTAGGASPHEQLFYFPVVGALPEAVRNDGFKLLRASGDAGRDRPHLTRLGADAESHDLRAKHPGVAAELEAALAAKRAEFESNPRGWR